MFLIRFTHKIYCQGYERVTDERLVLATSFELACEKLEHLYDEARDFENLTII